MLKCKPRCPEKESSPVTRNHRTLSTFVMDLIEALETRSAGRSFRRQSQKLRASSRDRRCFRNGKRRMKLSTERLETIRPASLLSTLRTRSCRYGKEFEASRRRKTEGRCKYLTRVLERSGTQTRPTNSRTRLSKQQFSTTSSGLSALTTSRIDSPKYLISM